MSEPTTNGQDGLAEGPEGDQPMSFWDHLSELRGRLVKTAFGVIAGCIVCFVYVTELRELLARPLHSAWSAAGMPGEASLKVLAMTDAFMTDMRIAVVGGLFIAAPIAFYQLWMFIAPGLYQREKRFVIPFVACSALMFLAGAAFCYFVVLPWTIEWLISYTQGTAAKTRIDPDFVLSAYVSDATTALVAFGAVFEFPLLIAFLSAAGLVTHRSLLRFWKISVILIFIIAAVLTPPEPVSQLMMAIPMVGLFFLSVGIAYLITRGGKTPAPEAPPGSAPPPAT